MYPAIVVQVLFFLVVGLSLLAAYFGTQLRWYKHAFKKTREECVELYEQMDRRGM